MILLKSVFEKFLIPAKENSNEGNDEKKYVSASLEMIPFRVTVEFLSSLHENISKPYEFAFFPNFKK